MDPSSSRKQPTLFFFSFSVFPFAQSAGLRDLFEYICVCACSIGDIEMKRKDVCSFVCSFVLYVTYRDGQTEGRTNE